MQTYGSAQPHSQHRQLPQFIKISVAMCSIFAFVLVGLSVVWLFAEVGRIRLPIDLPFQVLDERVSRIKSRVSGIESRVSNLASELSSVGAIARNADMYSHSHGYSDVRLKQDISPIENALPDILSLRGVRFTWRPDVANDMPPGPQIGVIAQELELVFPELVQESSDGYKTVDYEKLTAVLIEAVHQQQDLISQLEERVALLETSVGDPGSDVGQH